MGNKNNAPALDPFQNKVRLITLGNGENTYVLDVLKLTKDNIDAILELISKKFIIGHNLKFDLKTLALKYGEKVLPEHCFDTYLASRLLWNSLNPDKSPKGELTLKNAVEKYLNIDLDTELQSYTFNVNLSNEQINYASREVQVLQPLTDYLVKKLNKADFLSNKLDTADLLGNKNGLVELEMKFLPELIRTELSGIPVNDTFLNDELLKSSENYDFLKEYFSKLSLNPLSSKQCIDYLNELGLNVKSSGNDELLEFDNHEVVMNILQFRKFKKRMDLLRNYLNLKDGRLYSEFNQIEAHSGRMSSVLNQNI